MADLTPKQIIPGDASRGSVVHASDVDTVGVLSRSHKEEDISRLQSAFNIYDASLTYILNDVVINPSGVLEKANKTTTGVFTPADWDLVVGIESINTDTAKDQTISGGTGIDVVDSTPDHSIAIDATVATLTGSQTLTNKTIDGDDNTISDINETQQKVSVGVADTVLTSNGVGLAPSYQVPGSQTITNITLASDQNIDTAGDQDITNLTKTLPNTPGKHALVIFNVNYQPGNNDSDVSFGISDDASIVERIGNFGGKDNTITSITITYVAEMLGQVVKLTVDIQGGINNTSEIDIFGASTPASSMQVLELA